eukprot:7013534-Ditylum_brightwellii.AAC.1
MSLHQAHASAAWAKYATSQVTLPAGSFATKCQYQRDWRMCRTSSLWVVLGEYFLESSNFSCLKFLGYPRWEEN